MLQILNLCIRVILLMAITPAAAIPMKVETVETKRRTLYFAKKEFDQCGERLVRLSQTMTYSCTLKLSKIPKKAKLKRVLSEKIVEVPFGNSHRDVQIEVSEDARDITFSTGFDSTGIDFEISKFNDDFFSVYDKVAQLVIGEAMRKGLKLELIETR